jgi:hypothetical protein
MREKQLLGAARLETMAETIAVTGTGWYGSRYKPATPTLSCRAPGRLPRVGSGECAF